MDVEPVIDRAKMRQRVLRVEQAIDIPLVARSIIRKLYRFHHPEMLHKPLRYLELLPVVGTRRLVPVRPDSRLKELRHGKVRGYQNDLPVRTDEHPCIEAATTGSDNQLRAVDADFPFYQDYRLLRIERQVRAMTFASPGNDSRNANAISQLSLEVNPCRNNTFFIRLLSVPFLFLWAKRSLPASSVKLYVGFVQDAEHAATAAESRLLENLVDWAKRSLPASSVKLYVGFVQDAEHAAPAAESRLLENLVDGESFKIHIDHTFVALGTAHRLVAYTLDMFLDPAFMTRGLADSVRLLREQGDGCKHIAGPRFREQLVARIYPVMNGYQPYVHQSAELQKEDKLPRTTQRI